MKMLALIEAASLLNVSPYYINTWVNEAGLSLQPHPLDARSKCLTLEQVQQLATLHGCTLQINLLGSLSLVEKREEMNEERVPTETSVEHFPLQQEAELRQKIFYLENLVGNFQHQLAQLALIMKEIPDLTPQMAACLQAIVDTVGENQLEERQQPLQPAEQRALDRKHPPQVISTRDGYIITSSVSGILPIIPETSEWFAWLATLPSFRFVGKKGNFTAVRSKYKKTHTRSWTAERTVDKRSFRHYLGLTQRLLIDHLENAAADIEEKVAEHRNQKN